MYDSFGAFLRHRGVPPPLDEGQWDAAVATMLDYMYLDGRKVHEGQKLLAAVLWYHPQLTRNAGGRMAVARQSLRGWRRLDPSTGRLPIPLPVVHMIATWLMATERRDLGLLVLMTMELYLRPGEPLLVRPSDVIPKEAGPTGSLQCVSVLLNPFEEVKPSKTNEFDQSLMFDLERQQPLADAIVRLASQRQGRATLFDVAPLALRQALTEATQALRLQKLGDMHPYRLRHTGASVDFALKARRLEEVQRRGRWRTTTSLRRYEHGARLNELFNRLPPAVRQYAQHCSAQLNNVLLGKAKPSRAPW